MDTKEIQVKIVWIDDEIAAIVCPYCGIGEGGGFVVGLEDDSTECNCGHKFFIKQSTIVYEKEKK